MDKCFKSEKTFLVSGGLEQDNSHKLSHGQIHKKARLVKLKWKEKKSEVLLDYVSPPEVCPDEFPSIRFTEMTLDGSKLYLCTGTEVFIYSYPDLARIGYVSLPSFNDVHHVTPLGNKIAVVSSGLDMVIFLDRETLGPIEYKNVLFRDPWKKFDINIDYRKINSTNPHESHPNFIFEIDGKLWVTRCEQKDAVCLDNPEDIIPIKVERPHEGHVIGGFVYFTTIDGHIIVVDKEKRKVEETIDLNKIDGSKFPLGWCRGLHIDGEIAFVGFTKIRNTISREKIKWIAKRFSSNAMFKTKQTKISVYDIVKKKKLDEYVFFESQLNAIFSIISI